MVGNGISEASTVSMGGRMVRRGGGAEIFGDMIGLVKNEAGRV